ncbi:MAG TPA: hypothetical protein VIY86_07205, partial [Pirellulaceae bacterium]
RYRQDQARHPAWNERYLALHAIALGFAHPGDGRSLHFEVPLPWAFRRFVRLTLRERPPARPDRKRRP